MKNIRVRFAPSPTGPLHIGGVRTALFNYLLAKKHGGSFILRIEDTDQKRYVKGAEAYIIETLNWLGIVPNEGPEAGGNKGPYRQSERKAIYTTYVKQLLATGKAYQAFDTPEELDTMRDRLNAAGVAAPKYDHSVRMNMKNSLSLTNNQTQELIASDTPYVVRLLVQPGQSISFNDAVRGMVEFQSDTLDDKVLLKADGLPTYHMANVVDDYLMGITHVIRGEEWLSSTAHHVLLYHALGWENQMPAFAHLPLILKPNGKGKLSKRDGQKMGIPVFPIDWHHGDEHFSGFREQGFLKEAVINFLAFLGWNPGVEQELFSLEELVDAFGLDHVHKSGARFDIDKAKWFNHQHIIQHAASDLMPHIKRSQPDQIQVDEGFLIRAIELMKPRLESLNSFWEISAYLFSAPGSWDQQALEKKYRANNKKHLEKISAIIRASNRDPEVLSKSIKSYIQNNELKFGEILPVLRIAIAGTLQGPDLFEMISLIGNEESAARLNHLLLNQQ